MLELEMLLKSRTDIISNCKHIGGMFFNQSSNYMFFASNTNNSHLLIGLFARPQPHTVLPARANLHLFASRLLHNIAHLHQHCLSQLPSIWRDNHCPCGQNHQYINMYKLNLICVQPFRFSFCFLLSAPCVIQGFHFTTSHFNFFLRSCFNNAFVFFDILSSSSFNRRLVSCSSRKQRNNCQNEINWKLFTNVHI